MTKTKQGVSIRAIARKWGVDASYVSRFLKRAGQAPLPDGSYDHEAATAARERYTIIGKGQRTCERTQAHQRSIAKADPVTAPTCEGCGDHYVSEYSRNSDTPTPERFCSASCEQDTKDGYTPEEIARRRERCIPNKAPRFVHRPSTWTPPPKPAPIVRVCPGCGGRYDLNDFESRDPYCSGSCEHSVELGLTREEIRRSIRTGMLETGSTRKQVMAPDFFDNVRADGSPNIPE